MKVPTTYPNYYEIQYKKLGIGVEINFLIQLIAKSFEFLLFSGPMNPLVFSETKF